MELKIGKILTLKMKERGLSLRELSKLSGVPATTIGEWLSNRPPRNPMQMKSVADALDLSLHKLLFGVEDTHDPLQKILVTDLFSGNFQVTVKRLNFDGK